MSVCVKMLISVCQHPFGWEAISFLVRRSLSRHDETSFYFFFFSSFSSSFFFWHPRQLRHPRHPTQPRHPLISFLSDSINLSKKRLYYWSWFLIPHFRLLPNAKRGAWVDQAPLLKASMFKIVLMHNFCFEMNGAKTMFSQIIPRVGREQPMKVHTDKKNSVAEF